MKYKVTSLPVCKTCQRSGQRGHTFSVYEYAIIAKYLILVILHLETFIKKSTSYESHYYIHHLFKFSKDVVFLSLDYCL
jgi:hypothetical protein